MRIGIGGLNLVLEMSLVDTLMLLFLIGLTTGSFLLMKRMRKNRVTKLGNYQTLKEVHNSHTIGSPVILGAKVIVVCLLFMTATESISVEASQPVTDVDYVLAVDSSQSMLIPDYQPDRLGYVKDRVQEWVGNMNVRADMSVMQFSSDSTIMSLPTKNKRTTRQALDDIEVNISKSGTNIPDAINRSLELGDGPNSQKRVLIFTDGDNLDTEEIQRTVETAQNTSARLYFFDIPRNNRTSQLYRQLNLSLAEANLEGTVSTETDSITLQRVAQITGGGYYRVDNQEFFTAALQDTSTRQQEIELDSSYYILMFISGFVIFEMLLYSKYGAI